MGQLRRFVVAALAALASALPQDQLTRRGQINAPRENHEYDFVIIGGGTAGLTIADRLTQAFNGNRTVLVIEPGIVEEAVGVFEPANAGRGSQRISLESKPIPGMRNRRASLMLGITVGGSSAVNGQFFDRGCRYDYDDWRKIGSPEFDTMEDKWDWAGIVPWFKKSVTFDEPSSDLVQKFGFTWDVESAYGGSTPIFATYPPYSYPMTKVAMDVMEAYGIPRRKECAGGDKDGICWVPTSQNPTTGKRSHSGVGHYADVISQRPNYDLLTGHKAIRLIVDPLKDEAPTVEYRSVASASSAVQRIKPRLEVILSAGAIHTPQILQRSGIADATFLKSVGINVTLDLPGVGYNFHDHGGAGAQFTLSNTPRPTRQSIQANVTALNEATAQYALSPPQGPFTLAMGNAALYIPLPNITSNYSNIVSDIRNQIKNGEAASYLPKGAPPAVVKGYEAQLEILAQALSNPRHPVMESPFNGQMPGGGFLLKPLSRGSVMLNPSDLDGEPILEYGTLANPIDVDIVASFIPYFRRLYASEMLKPYSPVEGRPGLQYTSLESLRDYVRDSMTASFQHPCCTASMMPRERGGVVGPNLKVHGLSRLRVADISIVPLLPGTHTSATAYAIGEKAADIIVREWSKD